MERGVHLHMERGVHASFHAIASSDGREGGRERERAGGKRFREKERAGDREE